MGIPHFYGEVIAKSPLSKRFSIVADALPKPCARFFLDFNSIIHPCSASAVSKLTKESAIDDSLYKTIFANISDYTMNLIDITRPSDLVYIAIDGIAPRAKMHQQRKRRYLSAQRNAHIADFKAFHHIPNTKWDSNCITPGTDFMSKLDVFLETEFKQEVKAKFPFIKDIIVSGPLEEGEGEHKMMHYIKGTKGPSELDVVYGLDADLIMLSLTSYDSEIVLMRESNNFGDLQSKNRVPFKYLVIDHLRDSLLDSLLVSSSTSESTTTDQGIIADYVFVCYLLGNDFIPSLSFLKIKEGAVDVIMECYKQVCSPPSRSLITKDDATGHHVINHALLCEFIESLKAKEDELMGYVTEHYARAIPKPQRNFNTILQNIKRSHPHLTAREAQDKAVRDFSMDLEEYPLRHKFVFASEINPRQDKKWRNAYYHYVFGSNTPETIKDACKEYLNGLMWTVNYYFNLKADKEWYYPYHFAPCISDIHKYMHSISAAKFNEDFEQLLDGSPKTALDALDALDALKKAHLQLLLVLPPQSMDLLPTHLQPIMTDVSLGCVHFYPIEFEVNTYLKQKMWECHPIVPNIDKNKLVKHLH